MASRVECVLRLSSHALYRLFLGVGRALGGDFRVRCHSRDLIQR